MIALAIALSLSPAIGVVSSAYTRDGGEICVDVTEGLVDWGALALRKIGNARIDHPGKPFLRKHTGDYGTALELRVPPTSEIKARSWNVLHGAGVYRMRPDSLRVIVEYNVDDTLNVREAPAFTGEVCGHARPSLLAAFVAPEEFKLLGEAKWGST